MQARLEGVQQQLAARDAGVKGDNEKWLVRLYLCWKAGDVSICAGGPALLEALSVSLFVPAGQPFAIAYRDNAKFD